MENHKVFFQKLATICVEHGVTIEQGGIVLFMDGLTDPDQLGTGCETEVTARYLLHNVCDCVEVERMSYDTVRQGVDVLEYPPSEEL